MLSLSPLLIYISTCIFSVSYSLSLSLSLSLSHTHTHSSYLFRCTESFLLILYNYEDLARSCSSRAFGVVQSLTLVYVSPTRSGSIRIRALLPTLTLFVALLATISTFQCELSLRCREDFRQWCEKHIRRTKSRVNNIFKYTKSK